MVRRAEAARAARPPALREAPGEDRAPDALPPHGEGTDGTARWLAEPSGLPRFQNEAIVRLLAGDIGDDEQLRASLEGMRDEIAAARTNLDVADAVMTTIPHRERYLRLIHRYGRELLDMHERWLDEAERELQKPSTRAARRSRA